MSRWIVNIRGSQTSAASMDEVRDLARRGELGAGDLVQPPGARDWIYASEVPEFAAVLRPSTETPGVGADKKGGNVALAAVLALAGVGAWGYALQVKAQIPTQDQLSLTEGTHALAAEDAIVSGASAKLVSAPEGSEVAALEHDAIVKLLAKKGPWWQVSADGKEGWVSASDIIPGWYFQGAEAKAIYNPLFNPTQYVTVSNAGAEAGPEVPKGHAKFAFMFTNASDYVMSGIKLELTIKDVASGRIVETRGLAIEGDLPPNTSRMVGTLLAKKGAPPNEGTFMTDFALEKLLAADPSVSDRWADGAVLPLPADMKASDVGVAVKMLEVTPDKASRK